MRTIIYKFIGWFTIIVMILIVTTVGYTPTNTVKFSEVKNSRLEASLSGNPTIVFNTLRGELSYEIFSTVKKYANEFQIDYRLILAVIKHESQFNSDAISERGAEGLMQLMPFTHAEIEEKLYGQDSIQSNNHLRNGIYYLSKLIDLFNCNNYDDKIRLALAAYNAGPSRIYDAQELAAYLGENPNEWSVIERTLPFLSKRFYSLHQMVWNQERPPSGFFGGWKQTIAYVQNVTNTYQELKKII